MIIGCIKNDMCAGPVEIDDAGFEALTVAQRKAYNFYPISKSYGMEPGPGEVYYLNAVTRKNDTLTAHYPVTNRQDLIDRDAVFDNLFTAFEYIVNNALSTTDIDTALASIQDDMEALTVEFRDIMYPPEEGE